MGHVKQLPAQVYKSEIINNPKGELDNFDCGYLTWQKGTMIASYLAIALNDMGVGEYPKYLAHPYNREVSPELKKFLYVLHAARHIADNGNGNYTCSYEGMYEYSQSITKEELDNYLKSFYPSEYHSIIDVSVIFNSLGITQYQKLL